MVTKRKVLIIDNGGSTIKAGLSSRPLSEARVIQNAVVRSKGDKRQYIGHEFNQCRDYVSLGWRLPLEKGYLTDWDVQKAVWDGIMSEEVLNVDPQQTSLLITEPPFNFSSIQEKYDALIFEEYEFESYYRSCPAALIPYGTLFDTPNEPELQPPECSLIVDSGFSFTHITPIMQNSVVWPAVRRIDVGGKLLTNHLAQLISFRQWNMLEQSHIVNEVKETCCYVSRSKSAFGEELEACRANPKRNSIMQEYLLPDFSKNRAGRLKRPDDMVEDTDQLLTMENERFSVPEVLFRPNDIGMEQAGLAEAVANSISSLPEDLQGMFWANIGLIGGNTLIPGFEHRLLDELRPLAPADCEVSIYKDDDPVLTAYTSAHALANSTNYPSMVLTRDEYNEGGSSAAFRKFTDWKNASTTIAPIPVKVGTPVEEDVTEEEEEVPKPRRRSTGGARRGAASVPRAAVEKPKGVGGRKKR